MILLRQLIRLLLASFCYAIGILSTMAHVHQQRFQLIILSVSTFVLGTNSVTVTIFKSNRILLSIQCVLGAYFLAASVMLVLFLSKAPSGALEVTYPHHFNPIILTLILCSMLIMGVSIALDLNFDSEARHITSKRSGHLQRDARDWRSDSSHPDGVSPKDKTFTQVPAACVNFDKDRKTEKTLHNKDSEKTLVGPATGEEDMTLKWLIQASMSADYLYENQSENWMSFKPFRPGVDECNKPHQAQGPGVSQDVPADSIHVSKTRTSQSITQSHFHPSNSTPELSSKFYLQSVGDKNQDRHAPSQCRSTNHIAHQSPRNIRDKMVAIEPVNNQVYNNREEVLGGSFDEPERGLISQKLRDQDCAIHDDNESLHFIEGDQYLAAVEGQSQNTPSSLDPCCPSHIKGLHQKVPFSERRDSLASADGKVLRPAFEALARSMSNQTSNSDIRSDYLLNGLESIPMVGVALTRDDKNESKIKTLSLQDWDSIKHQWLQTHNDACPILISTVPDEKSVRSISAPSLHTYREKPDSRSSASTVTPSTSNATLHECITPPRQLARETDDLPALDSSPIKKIISRFKRRDSCAENKSTNVVKKHIHSNSITASMISAASGISSRSGSPRKIRSSYFSRTSLEQSPNKPTLQNSQSLSVLGNSSQSFRSIQHLRIGNERITSEGFWDMETGDSSDKSRVSSVPSAIIGEYDREKWRTLKELKKDDTVL